MRFALLALLGALLLFSIAKAPATVHAVEAEVEIDPTEADADANDDVWIHEADNEPPGENTDVDDTESQEQDEQSDDMALLDAGFTFIPRKDADAEDDDPSNDDEMLHKMICEGRVESISCPNRSPITIVHANYGRTDGFTCGNNGNTNCRMDWTKYVHDECNGRGMCIIRPDNRHGDPCGGVYKYINITYTCNAPNSLPLHHFPTGERGYTPREFWAHYNFPYEEWTTTPQNNDMWLTFSVTGSNDAHVVLSPNRQYANGGADRQDRYEIVIGGWGNSQSVIRRHCQGENKVADRGRYLKGGTPARFWVRYKDGHISIGRGELDQGEFLQWTDPHPIPVSFFDLGQWNARLVYSDIKWGSGGAPKPNRHFPFSNSAYIPRENFAHYNFPFDEWTVAPHTHDLWVTFYAACDNDASVILSPNRQYANSGADNQDRYEIVIAGWGNSQSVIRRHMQGPAYAADHGRRCHGVNTPTQFWVRYKNGRISVGQGSLDQNQFMTWTDPNPIPVTYFDFGKWNVDVVYHEIHWGSGGAPRIEHHFPESGPAYIPRENGAHYNFPFEDWSVWPKNDDLWVTFAAACDNDASVIISPNRQYANAGADNQDRYEIVISGWGGSQSVIRRHMQGPIMAVDRGRRCNGRAHPVRFWVRYHRGRITVGQGALDQGQFLSWTDQRPIGATYFDFGKWNSDVSYHDIRWGSGGAPVVRHHFSTGGPGYVPREFWAHYNFPYDDWSVAPKTNDLWLTFSAACDNDIHIMLSPNRQYANGGADNQNRYEIVIAGWGNTQSVIRRHSQGPNMVYDHGRRRCHGRNNPVQFWVRYRDGRISVGQGPLDRNEFMSWHDPRPIPVSFFDFGKWNVDNIFRDIHWG